MKKRNLYGQFAGIGINIAAGMAFFSFGGYWIDEKRGGGQAFTLCGMFLGVFYCGYEIWKIIKSSE